MADTFTLYCCGSRGSWPVDGHSFNEFGGNTSCYVLKNNDYAVIIDCGTGLYQSFSLITDCKKVDVLLTHVHYDHIIGLLDYEDLPDKEIVTFYGDFNIWFKDKSVNSFFEDPFCPTSPKLKTENIPAVGEELVLGKGLTATFYKANHPNNGYSIILKYNKAKLVVMFDNETADSLDFELVKDTNILLYDGMYSSEEYKDHHGYGHSCWELGIELAKKANVDLLLITHHSPHHTDTYLKEAEAKSQMEFKNTVFARAGQSWNFPYEKDPEKIEDYFEFRPKNIIQAKYKEITDKIKHSDIKGYYTIYFTNLFLGLFAIIFTLIDMRFASNIPYKTFFATGIAFVINALIIKLNKKLFKPIYYLFMVETMCAVMFLFYQSGISPFGFAWLILFPLCGMLVFGRKIATIDCTIILIILIYFLNSDAGKIFLKDQAPGSLYGVKYPLLFINFTIICFVIETVRVKYADALNKTLSNQEAIISNQVAELRDQNYSLIESNAKIKMSNDLLNKTFGRFIPENVIKEQLDNKESEVSTRQENITILYCGIRHFRTVTANMNPSAVIDMLNYYFQMMTNIIQENNGITLEYVGDTIFAEFSNDEQVDKALVSAIKMMNAIQEVNDYFAKKSYPAIDIGIGIHSGEVVLGVVGSLNHTKYSAVGNAVIVTSSIEHRSNAHQILVSEVARKKLKSTVHIIDEETFVLSHTNEPIEVYTIDGIGMPYNLSIKNGK